MPPVVLTEIPAQKRPASAERFFQWSLFLLVATGFVALMGTNRLDLPSLALVVSALLLRACLLLMHKEISIPERWTSLLTLAYFAFYAADFFYFSQTFITATVHLVLFILVVKIFSVRRDRDLVYLAVISFLMLLAAAVLTVDTLFLLAFALYIMVAIATFVSMEMRRSEKESLSAEIPPKHGLEFYRSLAGIASVLGALTLGGAALIFFILPRLNNAGYLGNLGAQGEIASGFSQDVRLGGIGQIQQSSAVVMHIQVLSGRLPLDAKWRGLSLSNFDGQRWWNIAEVANYHGLNNAPLDLTRYTSLAAPSRPLRRFATLSYRVVMEPVGLDVFFLAPVPLKLGGDYRTIAIASDGSVFSRRPAGNYFSEAEAAQPIGLYTADADTRDPSPLIRNSMSANYPPHVSSLYLQLPRLDPRIPELAKTITAGVRSNYEKAHAIETYLQNNFGYTLQLPGKNNADPLAYFLFERKKGHCEYFASAMTIMLRTLGIPARVVNGFRGGDFNDLTGNYIIRQRNAHSWVEVYFPEYGWAGFDPTPASGAPEQITGWSRLALYMDAASVMWREWVINYDFSHQMRLSAELSNSTGKAQNNLRRWLQSRYRRMVRTVAGWQKKLEHLSPLQMGLVCTLLAVLLALPFAPRLWRGFERARTLRNPQRAPSTAASFWYLRLLRKLGRRGFRKHPAQTPVEFAESIANPAVRQDVVTFTEHYERARFNESIPDAERLPELYEEIVGKK